MSKFEEILDSTERQETLDPTKSFIVQAPAGSGKTTLLAQRYLELLACVDNPEEILAITFTKKAASEMRSRILELLNQQNPSAEKARKQNQNKFWQIEENPNRLKIQTIDSLAYEVAKQSFGGVNYHDHTISESPSSLYRLAAERVLDYLYGNDPVVTSIANFLEFCSNDFDRACRMIEHMLAKRDQWLEISQILIKESFNSTNLLDYFNQQIQTLNRDLIKDLSDKLNARDAAKSLLLEPDKDLTSSLPTIVQTLTTQSGSFRKRLTIKDHSSFSDKELKIQITDWIKDLGNRELLNDFLAIRHLPKQLKDNDIQTITDICVSLTMAAAELEKVMTEKKEVDFTGIAISAQASLTDSEGPSELALQLGYQFRHLLIDEFQDTSRSQLKFFNSLMESWNDHDGQSFFAVGDPMQSIYSFRDADVSIFSEVQKEGLNQLPIRSIKLNSNFRSDPKIVDWINKLFVSPQDRQIKNLLGTTSQITSRPVLPPSENAMVQVFEFDSVETEIGKIVTYITDINNSDTSIGILCRSRNHLSPLLEALNTNSIVWQANDFYSLDNEPLIKDLLAMHQTLYSNGDKLAWMTILRSPLFGFTLSELEQFSQQDDVSHFIKRQATTDIRLSRLFNAHQWATANRFEFSAREVLEGLWLRMGGADAYGEEGLPIALAFFGLLDELSERAYQIEEIRIRLSNLHSPPSTKKSNVHVMTIHKAKGLEFDHVIIPFLDRQTRNQESPLLRWSLERQGLVVCASGRTGRLGLGAESCASG